MYRRHLSDSSVTLVATPLLGHGCCHAMNFSTKPLDTGFPLFEPCVGVGVWNDKERESRKDPSEPKLGVRRQRCSLQVLIIVSQLIPRIGSRI